MDQQQALRFVWLVLEIRPRLTQNFVAPYLMDCKVGILLCTSVAREMRCTENFVVQLGREYILQPRPVGLDFDVRIIASDVT